MATSRKQRMNKRGTGKRSQPTKGRTTSSKASKRNPSSKQKRRSSATRVKKAAKTNTRTSSTTGTRKRAGSTKRTTARKAATFTNPAQAKLTGSFEGEIRSRGDIFISPDATCKAKVSARNIRVDGRMEGDFQAQDQFFVRGHCKGKATAGSVRVDGNFEGDVRTNGRMEMSRSSNLKGRVFAKSLTVQEGATFEGTFKVGSTSRRQNRKAA